MAFYRCACSYESTNRSYCDDQCPTKRVGGISHADVGNTIPTPRATTVHPIPVIASWHRISVLLHLRLRPCPFSGHLETHVTRLFVLKKRVPFHLCECVVCVVFHRHFPAKAWKYKELLHVCFVFVVGLSLDIYFKPTFMRLQNIFAMFARALSFANISRPDSVFKCLWYITVFSTLSTSCLQK